MRRIRRAAAFAAAFVAIAIAVAPLHAQRTPAGPPATQAAPVPPRIDTLALRAHTHFLADDLLEGRGTGSRGARTAALYLSSELMRLGLRNAAPDGGSLQPIPMVEAVVDTAVTRIVLERRGQRLVFPTPGWFLLNTGAAEAFRSFRGEVVYAGTPRVAASALKARPLAGTVVAVLGPLGASALELIPDWRARGAAGVLLLIPDSAQYDLYRRSRGGSRFFVDAAVEDPVWQPEIPVMLAGPSLTATLLAAGRLAATAPDSGFVARDLGATLRATVKVDLRPRASANVAAILPGNDARLRDEYVVYTAHYDHLGISAPDERGDSIYNGFSDNAAGAAMLLAIAQEMKSDPPRRSVLFLFLTGEERGLLGSSFYAAEPLVPLERTVAVINLDAGAPPAPPLDWRLAGGGVSTLGETGRRIAARYGWKATASAPSPNSDYWPFLTRGVPALFLIPGSRWEGTSAEVHDSLAAHWDHYHQAADEWKADFPFAGLARYAALALAIGRDVAEAETRPHVITPRAVDGQNPPR